MRLKKDYLPGSSGSVGARVSKGLLVSPIGPLTTVFYYPAYHHGLFA